MATDDTDDGDDEVTVDVDAGDPSAMFAREVGRRLRSIRQAQDLSLSDVERVSGGRWSASAVGAYERGFRNLSLPRLRELARFYRVPMVVLLGEAEPPPAPDRLPRLVLDLQALATLAGIEPVQRYIQSIVVARGDYNGKVLTVRRDDLRAISAMLGSDESEGLARLREWGVLREPPS
ncbi:transcriptional regulator BldD [soil metagenome]